MEWEEKTGFLLVDISSSPVQCRLLCPDILSICLNSCQRIKDQKTGIFPKSSCFYREYLCFSFQDENSGLFISIGNSKHFTLQNKVWKQISHLSANCLKSVTHQAVAWCQLLPLSAQFDHHLELEGGLGGL